MAGLGHPIVGDRKYGATTGPARRLALHSSELKFRHPVLHRGWLVLNGVVSLLFGIYILSTWPASGLVIIGLFIGIDMIFDGWTEVMLALSSGSGSDSDAGPTPPQAVPA